MNVIDQGFDELKCDGPHHGRLGAIGDGDGRLNANSLAFAKRLLHIIARCRLHTKNFAKGRFGLRRQRAAAEQAAAAQAHKQGVQFADFFKQLQSSRPLARHNIGVVKRWNKSHAFGQRKLCGQGTGVF